MRRSKALFMSFTAVFTATATFRSVSGSFVPSICTCAYVRRGSLSKQRPFSLIFIFEEWTMLREANMACGADGDQRLCTCSQKPPALSKCSALAGDGRLAHTWCCFHSALSPWTPQGVSVERYNNSLTLGDRFTVHNPMSKRKIIEQHAPGHSSTDGLLLSLETNCGPFGKKLLRWTPITRDDHPHEGEVRLKAKFEFCGKIVFAVQKEVDGKGQILTLNQF